MFFGVCLFVISFNFFYYYFFFFFLRKKFVRWRIVKKHVVVVRKRNLLLFAIHLFDSFWVMIFFSPVLLCRNNRSQRGFLEGGLETTHSAPALAILLLWPLLYYYAATLLLLSYYFTTASLLLLLLIWFYFSTYLHCNFLTLLLQYFNTLLLEDRRILGLYNFTIIQ